MISEIKAPVDAKLVAYIEELLEDVKSGKVRNVSVVGEYSDTGEYFHYSSTLDFWRQLGAFEYAKSRIFEIINRGTYPS